MVHPWQDVSFEAFLSACFHPEALVSQRCTAKRGCLSLLGCVLACSGRESVLFSCRAALLKQSQEASLSLNVLRSCRRL